MGTYPFPVRVASMEALPWNATGDLCEVFARAIPSVLAATEGSLDLSAHPPTIRVTMTLPATALLLLPLRLTLG